MQTQFTKKIDFTGKDLFVGLDVHKKSWSVTIVVDGIEHRTFTQPPDPIARVSGGYVIFSLLIGSLAK